MSAAQLGAVLTLAGLCFEVVAVVLVLASVGLFADLMAALSRRVLAVRRVVGKVIPWVRPKAGQRDELNFDERLHMKVRADSLIETPNLPPPKTLEEVGEQLNDLRRRWNLHEKEFLTRAKNAREEVEAAKSEADSRAGEIERLFEDQAREALRDRRREAYLLVVGGGLQIVGAAIIVGATF